MLISCYGCFWCSVQVKQVFIVLYDQYQTCISQSCSECSCSQYTAVGCDISCEELRFRVSAGILCCPWETCLSWVIFNDPKSPWELSTKPHGPENPTSLLIGLGVLITSSWFQQYLSILLWPLVVRLALEYPQHSIVILWALCQEKKKKKLLWIIQTAMFLPEIDVVSFRQSHSPFWHVVSVFSHWF